ncbi:MAG: phospholipid carrier-dependent glycosyltransferase [Actinomycetota bacterium]
MRPPGTDHMHARGWSVVDLAAIAAVTLFGGALRLLDLGDPPTLVFDETYYARDACWYVQVAETVCGVGADHSEVHPPLGKWLLAGGIRVFGYDPFGWRIAAAIAGTITIALLYLLARRLLDSTLGAALASGLVAIDLLHLVQSRVAMLDVFVPLFGLAAVLFALYDRDRSRPRAPGGPGPGPSVIDGLLDRPWRLAAGAAAGAALASKWAGGLFLVAVLCLVVTWEVAARRNAGEDRPVRRAVAQEGPSVVAWLVIVPLLIYVFTFAGRLHGPSDSCSEADGHWINQLVQAQRCMYRFHSGLEASHPYQSPAWSWPLLKRPVSYYFQTQDDGDYMEILATGSPFVWWASLPALGFVVVVAVRNWMRRRGGGRPEGVIVGGFAFVYLPWMVLAGTRSAIFLFYLLPAVPFMCLALGYAAARLRRSRVSILAIALFSVVAVALFFFYRPVVVKSPLTPDQWLQRIWVFDDCDTSPRGVSTGTRTRGGPEEGARGWCWI